MGVQREITGTYKRRTLARAIAQALTTPAIVLGLVAATDAVACSGNPIVCQPSGNPYANGFFDSAGGSRNLTVRSGVRMEITNARNSNVGVGIGNKWSGSGAVSLSTWNFTVESGASINSDVAGAWGIGAVFLGTSSVTNHGDIIMPAGGGVYLRLRLGTGNVTSTGNIATSGDGIYIIWDTSTAHTTAINNTGLIKVTGSSGTGIEIASGNYSTLTIAQSGTVDTQETGVYLQGTTSELAFDNSGSISGAINGVVVGNNVSAGYLTNTGALRSVGTLADPDHFSGHAGLVAWGGSGMRYDNSGLIEGPLGIRAPNNGQSIYNTGTIHGTGGYAVAFQGNNNTLTLQTGSELIGDVVARAPDIGNKIVLEGTGSEDSAFSRIASLRMNGESWELSGAVTTNGAAADATRIDAGTLIVTGQLKNTNGGVTIANGGTLQLGNGGLVAFDASATPFDGQIQLHGIDAGPLGITNDGTLRFDHATPGFFFDTPIAGTGVIEIAQGTTRLTGDSSAFTGQTNVTDALIVHGALGGVTNVTAGGVVSGTGTLGDVVVDDGGTLAERNADLLTMQSLTLDAGAHIGVELGQAGNAALFDVGGALVLDGTLDITDAGGFGIGTYRLMNYAGTLTDNGLVVGATPDGIDPSGVTVQTSVANQVNVVSTSGQAMDFWDGAGTANNGAVEGGTGTWRAGDTNWSNADGALNRPAQQAFAVFQGAAGTVTVDGTGGTVSAAGLQFASDGYSLAGDALALYAPETVVRVGDGTLAGAAFVATIDAALTGDASLVKRDFGTLVLNGTNNYTGGTELRGGTVQVSSDANLGAAAGGLTFANARLSTTADMASARTVTFEGNGGLLDTLAGTTFTLAGTIGGTGDLGKSGAGRLTLSHDASAFAGATQLQGGTLRVDGALGGAMRVDAGATLEGTGTVGTTTFAGRIAPGDGSAHTGAMTVNGDLVAQGGTIRLGAILAGDGSPTSKLHVTGTSSGNGFIDVQHLGGAGARTNDGILLVAVDGTSGASFTLLGRVVAGPYDYTLYQGSRSDPTNGDWYLRSQLTVRPEPAAYLANQGAAFRMFRHGLDDRTGAARERGAWLRTQGTTLDETLDSGRLTLDQAHSLVQTGVDVWVFDNGMVGAMLGTGRADASVVAPSSGYVARAESRGEAMGVYATWFEHDDAPVGAYMDAWLQYGRYDHRMQGAFLAIEKYEAYATTASFESGYGVRIANGKAGALFVTPEAQVAWTGYRGKDHVEHNGTIVKAGKEAIATRLGAKLHAEAMLGRMSVRPYLAADWHHGAGDANAMTFDGVRLEGATPADRYTATLGAQADFGAGWSGSAEAEHAWGDGDYRELGAQLAVRYRW